MITRIEALNYRCFQWVKRDLGPFHVLVGPNGSGKSTFLDVPALAGDILRHGALDFGEAIEARAPNYFDLFWNGKGQSFEIAVEAEIPSRFHPMLKPKWSDEDWESSAPPVCRYEIAVGSVGEHQELGILREEVLIGLPDRPDPQSVPGPPAPPCVLSREGGEKWVTVNIRDQSGVAQLIPETEDAYVGSALVASFRFGPRMSAFSNLPNDESRCPVAVWFKRFLMADLVTVSLNSSAMRWPSSLAAKRSFQPDGSSLPWILESFLTDPQSLAVQQWLEHVRIAIPELRSVRVVERPEDRNRYLKLTFDSGLELPSWLVSDGTLRFLALSLLPYLPGLKGTYLVEEPENGIHPTAVELVFQALSSVRGGQVLVATHSPAILGLAEIDKVLCFRKSEEGGISIVPGNEHPNLRHWKGEVSLDVLFAGGVLG